MTTRNRGRIRLAAIITAVMLLLMFVLWNLSVVPGIAYTSGADQYRVGAGSLVYVSFPHGGYAEAFSTWHFGETDGGGLRWLPRWHTSTPWTDISFPLWIPVVLLVVLTVLLWKISGNTSIASTCSACGYDCTGVPDAAPCPECGKARAAEARGCEKSS